MLWVAGSTMVAIPLITAAMLGFGRRTLNREERLIVMVLGIGALLPHGTWVMSSITLVASILGVATILSHMNAHRSGPVIGAGK